MYYLFRWLLGEFQDDVVGIQAANDSYFPYLFFVL
jgi:hypothetical protein